MNRIKSVEQLLDVAKIRTDGDTQSRVAIESAIVNEYTELMKGGASFPPVRIWFDGTDYWLSDGFQRVEAAIRIGKPKILADVFCGTLDDARWDSYSANSQHGARRSEADIMLTLTRAVAHPRASHLSSNQIAKHLGIPEATFRRWKKRISSPTDEDGTRLAVRKGKTYTINTANIGKKGHGTGQYGLKSAAKLEEDLALMRDVASPRAKRLLSILSHWIRNTSAVPATLAAMEQLLSAEGETARFKESSVRGGSDEPA